MRVSLSQQIQNSLAYLNTSGTSLMEAQEHVITGKRILKSSDDVPGTNSALSLRSAISSNEQYSSNITVGQPLLDATLAAADDIGDIITKVREIAVDAATPDTTGNTNTTYAIELDNLMSQLVDIAKTKHNDQYVFSGTAR